jgi:hypothetical protein
MKTHDFKAYHSQISTLVIPRVFSFQSQGIEIGNLPGPKQPNPYKH